MGAERREFMKQISLPIAIVIAIVIADLPGVCLTTAVLFPLPLPTTISCRLPPPPPSLVHCSLSLVHRTLAFLELILQSLSSLIWQPRRSRNVDTVILIVAVSACSVAAQYW